MTTSTDRFEEVVGEHYQALFRFALSLTSAECDAWDLTQQTFCTWATKGSQLRDPNKAKSWLFTTLHRAFLTSRRRQSRFVHYELEAALDELSPILPRLDNYTDCGGVLPALAKIDEVFKAAVALFYLEDYSYKDIAAILDVPVGTVKSRIARGIAQLREIMLHGEPTPEFAQSEPQSDASSLDAHKLVECN